MDLTKLLPEDGALRTLSTPCLVVDGAALERNIERMAATARRTGVMLRPHAKTHKSPDVAALQLRADCTVGIACATVAEADAMAAAGIGGLLLTTPVMGTEKFARLTRLNRTHGLTVVVDHPAQIDGLLSFMQAGDRPLGVAVDVDVGQARTGVTDLAAGVALARIIAERQELQFIGIQGYAGHAQHMVDPERRSAAVAYAAATLRAVADALTEAGLPPALITGSGTGTHEIDARGPYNELQPGSYVFMDADYSHIKDEQGQGLSFSPSLFVLTTVVSVNRPGEVTVDAGTKALATNGPPPAIYIGAPPGTNFKFGGDEHGIIAFPPGERAPAIGARLLIGATHCDPTVNLHASFNVVTGGDVKEWPIRGHYGE